MSKNSFGGSADIFMSGLVLLFIALKMTGHIDWPWWKVLMPIWISVCVYLLIVAGAILWVVWKKRR